MRLMMMMVHNDDGGGEYFKLLATFCQFLAKTRACVCEIEVINAQLVAVLHRSGRRTTP